MDLPCFEFEIVRILKENGSADRAVSMQVKKSNHFLF
jgi:hypothetical protein